MHIHIKLEYGTRITDQNLIGLKAYLDNTLGHGVAEISVHDQPKFSVQGQTKPGVGPQRRDLNRFVIKGPVPYNVGHYISKTLHDEVGARLGTSSRSSVGWLRCRMFGKQYLVPNEPLIKAIKGDTLAQHGLVNSNLKVQAEGAWWRVQMLTDQEWRDIYDSYVQSNCGGDPYRDLRVGGGGIGEWARKPTGGIYSHPVPTTLVGVNWQENQLVIKDFTTHPYLNDRCLDYRPVLVHDPELNL